MKTSIVESSATVLLVGGVPVAAETLKPFADTVNTVVAADSGADTLRAAGVVPQAVIGDMDSMQPETLAALPPEVVHRIAEQDSTDFDKCLRNITAPLVLGLGFLGARLDHQMAAMTVLARRAERRCLLVGAEDLVLLCPPEIRLDLEPGCRVSLYPLGPVRGRSEGLRWPIEGLDFAPGGIVGTSNMATGPVHLWMEAPAMLVMLPVSALDPVRRALELPAGAAAWPARG